MDALYRTVRRRGADRDLPAGLQRQCAHHPVTRHGGDYLRDDSRHEDHSTERRSAHVGPGVRGYQGDARGHWEGNTLVVETTNFIRQSGFYGSRGETLRLTERFTRENDGIRYEVTVNDPATWTQPWTAALTLAPQPDGSLFEYACHEGNYSIRNILSAARKAEKEAGGR